MTPYIQDPLKCQLKCVPEAKNSDPLENVINMLRVVSF